MSPPESSEASRVAEFEQSLDELEQLVGRMEKGEMSLDESLSAYVGLYRQCRTALDQAELRVRQIIDPNDLDGAPRFDPDTP